MNTHLLFQTGDVFRRAQRLLSTDMRGLALFWLFVIAATEFINVYIWPLLPLPVADMGRLMLLKFIYTNILSLFILAVLIRRLMQQLWNETPSFPAVFQSLKSAFLPILIAGLLSMIGIMFGILLLIVPGFILLCGWYVFIPVILNEGLGSMQAIKRSWQLTLGYKWTIAAIVLIPVLIEMIAVQGLIFALSTLSGPMVWVVTTLLSVVVTSFVAALTLSTYYELLRVRREIDPESVIR